MLWQGILLIWTAFALIWWLIAIIMVATGRQKIPSQKASQKSRYITIFKALPGSLTKTECVRFSECIETFMTDMDAQSEMIIGCHDQNKDYWQSFLERMQQLYPDRQLKLIADADPQRYAANPKVSWMRILTPQASGELWFWSDADIEAPPGLLQSLRSDLASDNVQMVTSPYAIENVTSAAALIDALFVNMEFYPGVVLLGKLNAIQFGFGSGMLFDADAFREKVDWEFLGSCLADDYHLGQSLQPVKLGSLRVTTTPAEETWRGALLHYLRWQKTIRWNRPGGFGAQVLILPVLGWLLAICFAPAQLFVWWGLAVALALDAIAALAICRMLNCQIGILRLPVIPLWSILRSLTWLACWLPWPIVWRGRKWWAARQSLTIDNLPRVTKRSGVE